MKNKLKIIKTSPACILQYTETANVTCYLTKELPTKKETPKKTSSENRQPRKSIKTQVRIRGKTAKLVTLCVVHKTRASET